MKQREHMLLAHKPSPGPGSTLPCSDTLSQTKIITSGSHASASGSQEETLSRPDFYREEKYRQIKTERERERETSSKHPKPAGGRRKHARVSYSRLQRKQPYLCAVKVNHKCLDTLCNLCSDKKLVWYHAQIDVC